ncbi:DNA-binding LacI/PurR family transcriptional regulator [Microbacteriaceae bacterium SG_E_30_P1]|uniref:DNA-binding LacI/PurR family transcriptional regulator n=1 Tax=Antiquaquibacter oligotrophicus TaxID=2880260 RepID=A0ABT6KMF8_9MICO|nr:LacI family DNA-binding transcriptional regulator [Antiquaquibacter oligotrophicus]MDH6181199.1 DNA-binding LacI/PurR family transcriptional regulator [Antiquaquibacter oligotrophicus]UDF13106.1 LacI family DNA-binding transcriptional regulator [Antiquaquibacter oligotrophicus]
MTTSESKRPGSDEKSTRAANIFDVARLAGVSHQTVSRVLNNIPSVRPATRERVEQAIAQLRYSPSPAARALVTKRTRTIGLITPGTYEYGPTSTAVNFNVAARAARFSVDTVSSLDSDPSGVRAIIESLLRQRVDAIVLVVADIAVLDVVLELDLGIPIVIVAASSRHSPSIISIDQYRGARAAVRHLVELGHDRVFHVGGPEQAPDSIERVRGWRDEMSASRLVVPEVIHGDWSAQSGFEIGRRMSDISAGSAVFVANDYMALGVISALAERGLRVPEDVSVVGFDDVPEAAFFMPPLTTVRQDFASLGALIMQKVLIAIEEPDTIAESTPLPTRLIVRESTRPTG